MPSTDLQLHSTVALGLLTVLIVAASHAAAATIRVPQDHNTIQAGIDAASSGDVVVVDAGTYKERIHLKRESRSGAPGTTGKASSACSALKQPSLTATLQARQPRA